VDLAGAAFLMSAAPRLFARENFPLRKITSKSGAHSDGADQAAGASVLVKAEGRMMNEEICRQRLEPFSHSAFFILHSSFEVSLAPLPALR
jgi:hypothetical protein